MFFSSDRLIDTLMMTLYDAIYGRKGDTPMVVIHRKAFIELELEMKSKLPYGTTVNPDLSVPTTWILEDGSKVSFFRSDDIPLDKVYIFFESQVITITNQKHTDATDKNSLP